MSKYLDFAFSEQGFNHIAKSKECQDYSGSYSDEKKTIIAVADGHGSENYPRTALGSKYAVESAISAINEFVDIIDCNNIPLNLNNCRDINEKLRELDKNILKRWHQQVEENVRENPFTSDNTLNVSDKYKKRYLSGVANAKAYGTTLIAVCITENYWFGLQIGDGKCISFDEEVKPMELIPWDDACQMNVTTSICDEDSIEEFRHYYSYTLPIAVFIGSDGIDDSYASEEELYAVYQAILGDISELGIEKGKEEIKQFLPSISKNGSGDDVSIAGIVDTNRCYKIASYIRAKSEYEACVRAVDQDEKRWQIAKEKVEYISNVGKKAQQALNDVTHKLQKAQMDYERISARKQKNLQRLEEVQNNLKEMKLCTIHESDEIEVSKLEVKITSEVTTEIKIENKEEIVQADTNADVKENLENNAIIVIEEDQ